MPGSNKLVILAVITVLAVVAAVVSTRQHAPTVSRDRDAVFPGLTDKINDIARIEVTGKDGTLSIKRAGTDWVIEQADDYPASFSKVRQAAITLSELKILAEKTANPDYYSQLGVEDQGGEQAQSRLLTLFDESGAKLASLIIGKRRMSSAAAGSQGYYIRLPGGTRALLVEGDLNINAKPAGWFDPQIINIKPEHISEVIIAHPDQGPLRLSRTTAKDDFVLAEIPEDKEPQSSYTVNRIEDILEGVRVDEVRSAAKFSFPEQTTVATVKTYAGMTAEITSAVVDGANWSRFHFEFQVPPVPAVQTPVAGVETTGEDTKPTAETSDQGAGPAAEATGNNTKTADTPPQEKPERIDQQLVDQLTQKTTGWVYQIPTYKFDLFTRKLEDLVKDKEPEMIDEDNNIKKPVKPDG